MLTTLRGGDGCPAGSYSLSPNISYLCPEQITYKMFSGIVEEAAPVVRIEQDRDNIHITMRCSFTSELKIDQSVSHNGVCLTVVKKEGDTYTVTAIRETLDKTNLGLLKPGDKVNLERSTRLDGRLDGHMVQGHVDLTAVCTSVQRSRRFMVLYI